MELACIIISAVAALFSAVTALISYLNGKLLSQGNIELQIRTMISEAKYRRLEYGGQSKEIASALDEDLLNAYEEACAKYIDNKVDKKRFYKMYVSEIRQLVENEPYKKIFNEIGCKFDAIINVYNKWNHKDR